MIRVFFKNVSGLLIIALLFPAGCVFPGGSGLDLREGITAEVLEDLKTYHEQPLAFQTVILELSQRAQAELTGDIPLARHAQKAFAGTFGPLTDKLRNLSGDQAKIDAMNQYFFDHLNFRSETESLWEAQMRSYLLPEVMASKEGNCLSLSLLYLMIADQAGLPLAGVTAPDHFFIRYQGPDGTVKNIEATARGASFPDDYYRINGRQQKPYAGHLKSLSKREIIAVYLSNLANQYKMTGKHEKALQMFETASILYPDEPSILTNWGNVLERMKNPDAAIRKYHEALKQDPGLCAAKNNLGLAHWLYTKNYPLAVKIGRAAKSEGCRLHPDYEKFLAQFDRAKPPHAGREPVF